MELGEPAYERHQQTRICSAGAARQFSSRVDHTRGFSAPRRAPGRANELEDFVDTVGGTQGKRGNC